MLLFVCGAQLAWAENLMDIYKQAQVSDPTLQSAKSAYQAAQTGKPQARSFLLPNASFSANTSDNSQDSSITGKTDYNSNGYQLSVTQPVFRYNYFLQYKQAGAAVSRAEAEYSSAEQALILRAAERYFAVLAAKDNLEFARAEKTAIARQLEQAKKRFDVGLIAITDVHEAKAAYDLSVAQVIAAENQLATSYEALSEITGTPHKELAILGDKMPLITPDPANLDKWTDVALKQNLQLRAFRFATEVAQQNIRIQRSGHLPTLDIVASRSHSSGGGNTITGESDTNSIALQLNVPLFTGGLTTEKTREAIYLYDQARSDLEKQRRSTVRQIRDAYRGVLSGISRVKALLQATVSNRSALETTQAGFEVGTRTIVDVLVAQRELFRAQRDYAQARYDYLLNTLRLKQAAGNLVVGDLQKINQWLR
jgi:outer membrane protein